MRKKLIVTFLVMAISFMYSYGQRPQGDESTNPTFFQDILHYYMVQSEHVKVPDSVVTLLKTTGARNGIDEKTSVKMSTVLKPLFNDSLTAGEKAEVCKYEMRMPSWRQVIPTSYLLAMFKKFQSEAEVHH